MLIGTLKELSVSDLAYLATEIGPVIDYKHGLTYKHMLEICNIMLSF